MFKKHEEEMPFAKACAGVAEARVKKNRFIRTLLKRKCRFYRGDPSNPIVEHVKRWDPRWKNSMMPLEEFRSKYPGERWSIARLNKSLNTLIQPSAADQTKKAMRDLWYGERDLARRILVQIHDELCASVPHGEDGWRIADRVCEVMKAAVPLEVPSKVDPDIMATHWLGPSLNRDGTLKDDSRSLSEALFKEHYKTANRHHNGRRA